MNSKTKGRFGGFAADLADRAMRRPRLWVVPAVGLAARRLILGVMENGSGRGVGSVLAGLLVTLAVTAAFAELWISENGRVDADRAFEAVVLFLLPYPALVVVGWVSTQLLSLFVFMHGDGSGLGAVVAADLALSKIASMAITLLSALALARWKNGRGAPETLVLGWRALRANIGFVVVAGAATWAAQEALSVAFGFWREAAAGASPESFDLARLAQDYLVTAASLIGCVAAPIQAFKSGRLTAP